MSGEGMRGAAPAGDGSLGQDKDALCSVRASTVSVFRAPASPPHAQLRVPARRAARPPVRAHAHAINPLGTPPFRAAYDRVLRRHDKAGAYYLRCMQLAASMAPRCFTSEPWYAECRDALQRFQAQAAARDEAARQAEREPFLQAS